jgi:hypothetical protein
MRLRVFGKLAIVLGVAMAISSLLPLGTEAAGAANTQGLLAKSLLGMQASMAGSSQANLNSIDAARQAQGSISQTILNRNNAAKLVQSSIVDPLWAKADQRKGLRVLEYQDLLPQGTSIEPAFATQGKTTMALVAQNPSWLFMIDEAPGAHFSHPVKLVLVDTITQKQQVIEAEWWPKINKKQVFDTVAARTNLSLITFDKAPSLMTSRITNLNLAKNIFTPTVHCVNWAVIVCGFNDPSDTFHVDTNGIYSVLKSLGLDDSHIFYLSPQTGDPGVDRPTNVANVQWAISQVAAKANSNDKVLFLYSAHGGIDSVACAPDVDPVGYITASNLANWLNTITCKEMSIIMEACHSGSFIGKYKDGTYVASEDDLTGHGESNRVVFTSASTDTSSYPDVDGPDDPNAATDTGSESIYGFIMAYSIPSADKNHDGRISFGEAYQYAWDNDVTRIRDWNTPQLREAGLNKNSVYLECIQTQLHEPLTTVPMTIPKLPPEGYPNPLTTPITEIVPRTAGV